LEHVQTELKDFLIFFGYAKLSTDAHNFTGFYEFESSEDVTSQYYGYRVQNESVINWITMLSEDEMSQF
jgi:hypothetical protein